MAEATTPAPGQGSPASGAEGTPPPAPQFVTAEQLNAAIGSHLKRLKIPGADDIKSAALEAFKAAREAEAAEAAAKKDQQSGKAGNEAAPEVVALRKQVEALTKKQLDAEAKAQRMEQENQIKLDNELVLRTLESGGVTGQRARVALNHLRSEGFIRRGDSGLTFVTGDMESALADGIGTFLKTDEGKLFLPPSGAQGAGTRTPGVAAQKPGNANQQAINDFLFGRSG
jgi:hypothetical protein